MCGGVGDLTPTPLVSLTLPGLSSLVQLQRKMPPLERCHALLGLAEPNHEQGEAIFNLLKGPSPENFCVGLIYGRIKGVIRVMCMKGSPRRGKTLRRTMHKATAAC